MAWEVTTVLFLVALLYLALAAFVLYLAPSHSVHRTLAVFLSIRALSGLLALGAVINPAEGAYWSALRGYAMLALPFLIIDFFIVSNWRSRSPARRTGRIILLTFALLVQLAYLSDHGLLLSSPGDDTEPPLNLINRATFVLAGLLGVWFARASHTAPPVLRRFCRLLAVAWASYALVESALYYSSVSTSGFGAIAPDDHTVVEWSVTLISFLEAAAGLAAIIILLADRRLGRAGVLWVSGIALASIAVPFAASLAMAGGEGTLTTEDWKFLLLLGLARLIFPMVLGYAVVRQFSTRHAAFEIDYTVRVAFRKSSLGGLLLATYFIISQLAGDIFPNIPLFQSLGPLWGQILGLASAGVLLLALQPLSRAADRLAQSAVPRSDPSHRLSHDERIHVYEEQVQLAWADGSLTRKERLLLDRLRERLGVPLAEAAAIERRILQPTPLIDEAQSKAPARRRRAKSGPKSTDREL